MSDLTIPQTDRKADSFLVSRRRWEQIGAAGGIAFVVLQLAGQSLIQVGGAEPPFSAPAEEILAFFAARDSGLFAIGGFLSTLSAVAFVWFLGVLWAALRRHEEEPAWLSLVAFGSGLAAMAVTLAGSGWELAVFRIEEGLSAEAAMTLFDQGNFGFATLWVPLAGLVLATSVLAIREGALPRWLGWYGLLLTVGLLAARTVWASSGIAFGPYVLFWVWLIATSVALMRRVPG
jgi:hypothetical protein